VYQGPGLLFVNDKNVLSLYRPIIGLYCHVENLFYISLKIQLCFLL
jgi:hypothetical protein